MKKLLALLGASTMVVSSSTAVLACNTQTVNAKYTGINSLNTIWTTSPINTIPLNLIRTTITEEETTVFQYSKAQLVNEVKKLFEYRISGNTETWSTDSESFEFGFYYQNNEISDDLFSSTISNLVDKYNFENSKNTSSTFLLTFTVKNADGITNKLNLSITNRETISLNIDESSNTLTIENGIKKYLEIYDESEEKNVLWLDESSISSGDELTAAKLREIIYYSLINKIINSNYLVYINKIYTQVSAKNFELQWRPLSIIDLINYIINPVKNDSSVLEFNENNSEVLGKITQPFSRIDDYLLFGTKFVIRSVANITLKQEIDISGGTTTE